MAKMHRLPQSTSAFPDRPLRLERSMPVLPRSASFHAPANRLAGSFAVPARISPVLNLQGVGSMRLPVAAVLTPRGVGSMRVPSAGLALPSAPSMEVVVARPTIPRTHSFISSLEVPVARPEGPQVVSQKTYHGRTSMKQLERDAAQTPVATGYTWNQTPRSQDFLDLIRYQESTPTKSTPSPPRTAAVALGISLLTEFSPQPRGPLPSPRNYNTENQFNVQSDSQPLGNTQIVSPRGQKRDVYERLQESQKQLLKLRDTQKQALAKCAAQCNSLMKAAEGAAKV